MPLRKTMRYVINKWKGGLLLSLIFSLDICSNQTELIHDAVANVQTLATDLFLMNSNELDPACKGISEKDFACQRFIDKLTRQINESMRLVEQLCKEMDCLEPESICFVCNQLENPLNCLEVVLKEAIEALARHAEEEQALGEALALNSEKSAIIISQEIAILSCRMTDLLAEITTILSALGLHFAEIDRSVAATISRTFCSIEKNAEMLITGIYDETTRECIEKQQNFSCLCQRIIAWGRTLCVQIVQTKVRLLNSCGVKMKATSSLVTKNRFELCTELANMSLTLTALIETAYKKVAEDTNLVANTLLKEIAALQTNMAEGFDDVEIELSEINEILQTQCGNKLFCVTNLTTALKQLICTITVETNSLINDYFTDLCTDLINMETVIRMVINEGSGDVLCIINTTVKDINQSLINFSARIKDSMCCLFSQNIGCLNACMTKNCAKITTLSDLFDKQQFSFANSLLKMGSLISALIIKKMSNIEHLRAELFDDLSTAIQDAEQETLKIVCIKIPSVTTKLIVKRNGLLQCLSRITNEILKKISFGFNDLFSKRVDQQSAILQAIKSVDATVNKEIVILISGLHKDIMKRIAEICVQIDLMECALQGAVDNAFSDISEAITIGYQEASDQLTDILEETNASYEELCSFIDMTEDKLLDCIAMFGARVNTAIDSIYQSVLTLSGTVALLAKALAGI